MSLIKKFFIIFFLLLPISNSFGAMVTHNQTATVSMSSGGIVAGVEFNSDGTKMFTSFAQRNGSDNLGSEYKISKNINDFEIDLELNNQDVLKPNTIDEAMVNLSRIF